MYWWKISDLNRSPPACKTGALPDELIPHKDREPSYLSLHSLARLSRIQEFIQPINHTIVSDQLTPLILD